MHWIVNPVTYWNSGGSKMGFFMEVAIILLILLAAVIWIIVCGIKERNKKMIVIPIAGYIILVCIVFWGIMTLIGAM